MSPEPPQADRALGLLARRRRPAAAAPCAGCARAPCSRSCRPRVSASARRPAAFSALGHLVGVAVGLVGDRRHHRLHRRQPQRQPAGIVLDQHADEALERAQDRPVQHHRPVLGAVLADIVGVQPLRQDEVDLQRAALPVAADRVAQHELELRAVEGALAGVERALEAGRAHGLPQAPPRPGPRPRPRRRAPAAGRRTSPARRRSRSRGRRCISSSQKATLSAVICSGVQKMCASSWVKARTRMMPCSAPDGSLRWQEPNSAMRSGRSR